MTRDSCAPCCHPEELARQRGSYEAAQLLILCSIVSSIEELIIIVVGEGVVLPQVEKTDVQLLATAGVYTTVGFLDSTFKLRHINVNNNTDAAVKVSLDGGVTTAFTVPAGSFQQRDIGQFTGSNVNSVMYTYDGAGPDTGLGSVYFDGSY